MKSKFTIVPIMAMIILAGTFSKALAQDESNFRYIDNFEPPTEVSLWWHPQGSGSTTGIILTYDDVLVTYRVANTVIFNPHTASTMSMKLAYMWDADKPLAPGSHLIRQFMPETNSDLVGRRFLPNQAIEVFVYGDGSGNKFRFMTREKFTGVGGGQLEGSQWFTIDWTGWKRITWRLSEDPVIGWVNGNGAWNNDHIVFDSFQLTWSGQTSAITGAVYFDDLRIVDPFDVNFVVQDAGGSPITDATIHLNGTQHPAGNYDFDLFPGSYSYFVKKDGLITTTGTFEIDDQNKTITVVMTPGTNTLHTLAFTVLDLDGELITDATIKLNGVAGTPGNYSFSVVPGFYHYNVTAPGFYSTGGLTKVVSSDVFVNVELKRDPSIFNTITLSWKVAPTATDPQHRLEKYSVWITKSAASGKTFDPADYEKIFEETLTAEIGAMEFQSRTVNLSWHHSQTARIAFRHHGVTGMDRILIDDVKIEATRIGGEPAIILDENFNNGVADPINPDWLPENWLKVDQDNDGHNWFFGATGVNGYMVSRSGGTGKTGLTPDNWLVSKQVTLPVVIFYNVTFVVRDQLNNNVEGAVITFRGQAYAAGHYAFSVPNGSYDYSVAKAGYVGTSGTVSVHGGSQIVTVTIQQILHPVVFNVDMRHRPGGFTPGDHTIFITGSFPGVAWATPGTLPALQLMAATDNVFIFTKTLTLPTGTFMYKYFDGPSWGHGEWQGDPDRSVTVTGEMTVNDWFGHVGEPTDVELIDVIDVKVYPNPARSNLNIVSGVNINQVRLVDMLGQVVYSANVNGSSHKVSVNSLRSGIYIVQIFSDNGLITRKVQVQQ